MKEHHFQTTVTWSGNKGSGTAGYASYDRSHTVSIKNKPDLLCSSDPAFLGDGTKYNPEDLLIASLSACHMLWYLHLCSDAGIIVTKYSDEAKGLMKENDNGGGHFISVVLYPTVVVTEHTMIEKAKSLHDAAHKKCFIANSCNFPVTHIPKILVSG
jgi:organic hydroperoxide reductase OsmC/OhrA